VPQSNLTVTTTGIRLELMRDIRQDIRERLDKLESERLELKSQLEQLSRRELTLKALLQEEDSRWSTQVDLFYGTGGMLTNGDRTAYAKFLGQALANHEPATLDALKDLARQRGLDFEGKNPGRVLHFALLGMQQNGTVEMVESGVWRLK
jgi:hypothetical protein